VHPNTPSTQRDHQLHPDTEATLPRRNLQVARPHYLLDDVVRPDEIASAIEKHLLTFGLNDHPADVALALTWNGVPSYRRLRSFAEGITPDCGGAWPTDGRSI
jgi:ethanolamine utilization protein EutA